MCLIITLTTQGTTLWWDIGIGVEDRLRRKCPVTIVQPALCGGGMTKGDKTVNVTEDMLLGVAVPERMVRLGRNGASHRSAASVAAFCAPHLSLISCHT